MMEGRRWVDTRRYNRLNTLPKDLPTHFVAIVQPVPLAECDARNALGDKITGC
jgi:predicted kinase